jgi:23S rRNA-/tRNA-specific pseudouridylate synthase
MYEEDKVSKETQPSKEKKPEKVEKTLVATKTCNVRFENRTAELVEGQPITGLTRQERDHLKFHGFLQ